MRVCTRAAANTSCGGTPATVKRWLTRMIAAVDATASTARVRGEEGAANGIRPVPTTCPRAALQRGLAPSLQSPKHALRNIVQAHDEARARGEAVLRYHVVTFSTSDGKTPPSRQ